MSEAKMIWCVRLSDGKRFQKPESLARNSTYMNKYGYRIQDTDHITPVRIKNGIPVKQETASVNTPEINTDEISSTGDTNQELTVNEDSGMIEKKEPLINKKSSKSKK